MASLEPPRKRPKSGKKQRDYIEINVGGTLFSTSKSTLIASSTYFKSRLSSEWHDGDCDEALFVDQDSSAFKTLLNFMRYGCIKASEITATLLSQADYLGIELLLRAVRLATYRFMYPVESENMDDDEICDTFDTSFGGIIPAIRKGILPQHVKQRSTARLTKEYICMTVTHLVVREANTDHRLYRYNRVLGYAVLLENNKYFHGGKKVFPTFLEAMNWLHQNGFVTPELEESFQNIKPRSFVAIEDFWDHYWFSRSVYTYPEGAEAGSPITFEYDEEPLTLPAIDRRKFAALITCNYPIRNAPTTRNDPTINFVMAEGLDDLFVEMDTVIPDHIFAPGDIPTTTKVSVTDSVVREPLEWLGAEGYVAEEKKVETFFQRVYRDAVETGSEMSVESFRHDQFHVKIFSRTLDP
jgi:hypothetical protein